MASKPDRNIPNGKGLSNTILTVSGRRISSFDGKFEALSLFRILNPTSRARQQVILSGSLERTKAKTDEQKQAGLRLLKTEFIQKQRLSPRRTLLSSEAIKPAKKFTGIER